MIVRILTVNIFFSYQYQIRELSLIINIERNRMKHKTFLMNRKTLIKRLLSKRVILYLI